MGRIEGFSERSERLREGARLLALERLLENAEFDEGFFNALGMIIVDAILDGDEHTLHRAQRQLSRLYADLRQEHTVEAARVLGHVDNASWGIERTISLPFVAEVEQSSHAHEFIKTLAERPGLSNGDLVEALGTSDSEISRVGRRLVDAGLVTRRRLGRRNFWEVTPKGFQTLDFLEQGGTPRHQRPHYQLR